MALRFLFIGDVVGGPGRKIVSQALPLLRARLKLDLVICNAENAAGGSGLTVSTFDDLREAGVDAFTLGDHAYRKDDIHSLFAKSDRLCRPANFPPDAPGPEVAIVETASAVRVAVFTVLGRTFMKPVDCPLRASDRLLTQLGFSTRVIVCDVHAEATSEKQLLARYLDGRITAVLGTHTHVPTADEQLLPGGTAYQTDVGMTGPYESVIGRRYDRVLTTTLTALPQHFDVATGDPRLAATLVEVDPASGRSQSIRRLMLDKPQADRLARQADWLPDLPRPLFEATVPRSPDRET
jgi:metallophosphoesterase (TIGR00282 family)